MNENEVIKDCENVMTIKNLSSKRFKVTLEVIEGEPLTSRDFEITIPSGDWALDLKVDEEFLEQIKKGEENRNPSGMSIEFSETNSIISGESGDSIGRGDRAASYFVLEEK